MPRLQLAPNAGRAEGCLAWPNVSGRLSTVCVARPSLRTWRSKKETYFLPAPHTYQFTSRTGRDSCRGKKAERCQMQVACWWRRREHILPQKVKERGQDLKGEGKGSHVMHLSSTAEPPTSAKPQSPLCADCAKSLRNSHWLPQEGCQQNRGSVTQLPWNSTYPSQTTPPWALWAHRPIWLLDLNHKTEFCHHLG